MEDRGSQNNKVPQLFRLVIGRGRNYVQHPVADTNELP
jgi:hypothetical protein